MTKLFSNFFRISHQIKTLARGNHFGLVTKWVGTNSERRNDFSLTLWQSSRKTASAWTRFPIGALLVANRTSVPVPVFMRWQMRHVIHRFWFLFWFGGHCQNLNGHCTDGTSGDNRVFVGLRRGWLNHDTHPCRTLVQTDWATMTKNKDYFPIKIRTKFCKFKKTFFENRL
jgi:hypothetical protein